VELAGAAFFKAGCPMDTFEMVDRNYKWGRIITC